MVCMIAVLARNYFSSHADHFYLPNSIHDSRQMKKKKFLQAMKLGHFYYARVGLRLNIIFANENRQNDHILRCGNSYLRKLNCTKKKIF